MELPHNDDSVPVIKLTHFRLWSPWSQVACQSQLPRRPWQPLCRRQWVLSNRFHLRHGMRNLGGMSQSSCKCLQRTLTFHPVPNPWVCISYFISHFRYLLNYSLWALGFAMVDNFRKLLSFQLKKQPSPRLSPRQQKHQMSPLPATKSMNPDHRPRVCPTLILTRPGPQYLRIPCH